MKDSTERIRFESLLAEDDLGSGLLAYKSAQASDDTQFAQDFSNLAFTFIQDRAPALMPYILGFELVDREPDGTKAVGVFGFKVGDDYYYVPAFFMNNQVKGVDLLLSKKTNSFVPLSDDWIGFIVNRSENKLGDDVDASKAQEDFENPDFEFLRRPTVGPLGGPVTFKGAEAGPGRPWSFATAWKRMEGKALSFADGDQAYAEGLRTSLGKMAGARSASSAVCGESPIRSYLRRIGGPAAAGSLSSEVAGDVKFASALMEFYNGVSEVFPDRYDRECLAVKRAQEKAEVDKPKVLFTDRPDHTSGDEESARDIVSDGFTVVDRRGEEEKSSVVEMDYEDEFGNPDVPGTYDVLLAGGAIRRAEILDMNRVAGYGTTGGTVVRFPDNGQTMCVRKRDIIVHGERKGSAREIYDGASPIPSVRIGKRYVFVGPDGSCIGVVDVHGVSKEKGARPVIDGYLDSYCRGSDDGDGDSLSGSMWSPSYCDRFELADYDGNPAVHGSTVVLPRNWKAIDAGDRVPYHGDLTDSGDEDGDDEIPESKVHRLGSMATLQSELRKAGAAPLDMRSDDGEEYYWSFDGSPYTAPVGYKDASVALVAGMGLGYGDARSILKAAAASRAKRVLVKAAQAMPGQFVGVGMGQPAQQTPGSDPYTGIPAYDIPFEDEVSGQFTGVPQYNPENVQGENLGGEASIQSQSGGGDGSGDTPPEFDPEAAQLAQDAAASGQKEVFDLAAIGGLAKVYDTGDVVDSYLPEFMQALDRLGRTLFLYFWKHDDFVERYGTGKVVEMEDLLRSTFKQLGSLTLDLRKKAVGQGDGAAGPV